MQYAGTTVPTGWLLCDGSVISRTTYAFLYNAIGTTYGQGDGSTTFSLPNLADKFVLGKGTTYSTLGATGGEKTHTLSIGELPSHGHSGSTSTDGNHAHSVSTLVSGSQFVGSHNNNNCTWGTATTSYSGSHSHTVSISNTGNGQAHNNMPPYIVMNYIIKY